jgi:hypothetical protein
MQTVHERQISVGLIKVDSDQIFSILQYQQNNKWTVLQCLVICIFKK